MGGAGLSPVRRVATALALTAGLCAAAAERAGADEIGAVEVAPRDAAVAPTPSPIDSCKLIW